MTLRELQPLAQLKERPERSPDQYLPMQEVTRQIAFGDDAWSDERRVRIAQLFDSLAPEWHTRGGEARLAPTRDALSRGYGQKGGLAVEIGSGTGLQTPVLKEVFDEVVSLDLSAEMLALSPRREGVFLLRGDASRLPLCDGSADAVVCVNAYLFCSEYARVLNDKGKVVFVSTSGDHTPIYLPPADVVRALEGVLGPVEAVTSCHGWSSWTVIARAER